MALQTIKATIQVRYGMEADLQPDKLVTGEWAVAKDTRKVWMCFRPGLVLRMATYEAFEQDMTEIQTILATCQDIQVAVERFMQLAQQHASQAESWSVASKSWAVGGTGTRQGEDTNNSEYWSRLSKSEANRAKEEADRASAIAEFNPDGYFSFSGGRAISENEDLNNFSDLGNYYCPANNVAYTLENCPAKNAFTMKIFYGTGNGYITQAIRDFYYGNIFSRYKGYSGNWSEWKSLDTTYSEMTAASASAAGQSGLVPAPAAGKQNGYLRGDGTWVTPATNLLGTVPGIPLDQTMGKQLEDKITKINSDLDTMIADFNTKFKTLTGTFGNELNVGTLLHYPEGFTRQNTVIISVHYGDGLSLRDQFYANNLAVTVMLHQNNIEVTPRYNVVFGHNFKIVLMKI